MQLLLGTGPVQSVAWSPDGRGLAVGSQDKRPVRLWDAETGRRLQVFETPSPNFVQALAWSADGKNILTYLNTHTSYDIWNVADGKLVRSVPIECHIFSFAPDGKRLTGQRGDGSIIVCNTETGKEEQSFGKPSSRLFTLAWSSDGKRLASAQEHGLYVWDVPTGKQVYQHEEDVSAFLAWSPDGRKLAYNFPENWGVATIELEPGAKPQHMQEDGIAVLAWSPDGKTLRAGNGAR